MFDLMKPCVNCPFKKGQGEYFTLPEERIDEIVNATAFQCHKTIGSTPQQCAGLMSILHKEESYNPIMKMGMRFGELDTTKLDPNNESYGSISDAKRAHNRK